MNKYTIATIIFILGVGSTFLVKDEKKQQPIIVEIDKKDAIKPIIKNTTIVQKEVIPTVKKQSTEQNNTLVTKELSIIKLLHQSIVSNIFDETLIAKLRNNLDEPLSSEISKLLQSDNNSLETKRYIISLLDKVATVQSAKLFLSNIHNIHNKNLIAHIQKSFINLTKNSVEIGIETNIQPLLIDTFFNYHEDERYNQALITSIAKIENNETLTLLEKEIDNEENSEELKATILSSANNLSNPKLIPQLLNNLKSESSDLMALSATALASIATEDAVSSLLEWSSDFDYKDNTDNLINVFTSLYEKNPELREELLAELEVYDFDADIVKEEIQNIFDGI